MERLGLVSRSARSPRVREVGVRSETLVQEIGQAEFMDEFRNRGFQHPLWTHPFLERIECGDYTIDDLRTWAIQAGRIDQAFAEILSRMLLNPSISAEHHAPLEENLQDELGHGNPEQEHFTLFQDVLRVIGVSEKEYEDTPMTEGTRGIVEMLLGAADDSSNPLRIASLMANEELICPREFPIFLRALEGLTKDRHDLRYFDEHIDADVQHSEDLMRIVYEVASKEGVSLARVRAYQDEDLQANFRFYEDMPKLAKGM